ncbi:Hsp20/alpha crystallin family protein [Candidatus Falkowbacteria bacterium]|nr:Hsp20/alpha crystallin family protein [Candidatus Falkowbacteria bacterium]
MTQDKTPIFFTSLDDLKNDLDGDQANDRNYLNLVNKSKMQDEEQWFAEDYEGQLSIDVYQNKDNLVVKSTIAGVKPEDLEIYIHNDLLTIRGRREQKIEDEGTDYLYKECYWGGFSRSIILPFEVQVDKVQANLKNGVLTIIMPKAPKSKMIPVKIHEE